MAGTYVELTNPGYSALFTRDLTWNPNTAGLESGTDNAFDPDASNPLYEGEWLEMSAPNSGSGTVFMRDASTDSTPTAVAGSILAVADDGTGSNAGIGTAPSMLYFQERGRYDAQVTQKAHCIVGPHGMEFRSKMAVIGAADPIGDRLYVCWGVLPTGAYVRCLASATALAAAGSTPAAGDYYVGSITRVHGVNDASVLFAPGYHEGS